MFSSNKCTCFSPCADNQSKNVFTCSALEVLNCRVSLETVLPTAFMPSMTSVDANDVVDVEEAATGSEEVDDGFIRASSSGTT